MKIHCDVCEKAEATLLCCADEAALCSHCDNKVHAANKLASKHQRISLIKPSLHMPKCDICQEKAGYFFCLEDRALLCHQCDVSVHSVNPLVAAHQRFLVTGIKVGLEPANPISSSVKISAPLSETPKPKAQTSKCSLKEASPATYQGAQKGEAGGGGGGGMARRGNVSEYWTEFIPGWRIDEFLNIPELDNIYGFCEAGSSKADNVSSGETEWTASPLSIGETNVEDCLAQVPEIPSPPTASGLYWPRSVGHHLDSPVVPDIGCLSSPPDSPFSKRRRLSA